MKLALFDFDGTITTKDSLADFIQYAVGRPAYYMALLKLSPMLAAYMLKLIPNHIAKEKFIAYFFKEWSVEKFQRLAEQYSLEKIDDITRLKAMQRIKWHQDQGQKVIIVSASIECWLKPWCDKHHIDLIATRLEVKDHKLTGKFATKNCHGIEKTNRIRARYDLYKDSIIYAYGNSPGDKEMLHLATEQYYQYFH